MLRDTRLAPTPRGASKAAIVEFRSLDCLRVDGVEARQPLLQDRLRRAIGLDVRALREPQPVRGLYGCSGFELLVDDCWWIRGTSATAEIYGARAQLRATGPKASGLPSFLGMPSVLQAASISGSPECRKRQSWEVDYGPVSPRQMRGLLQGSRFQRAALR